MKTQEELTEEYQTVLDFIEYLLANYKYEFDNGFGMAVLQGQASFYKKMLNKE